MLDPHRGSFVALGIVPVRCLETCSNMPFKRFPSLAIIGCGLSAERLHLPALRAMGWKPSAIVDIDPLRLDHFASLVDVPLRLTEFSALPETIAVALVTLPQDCHADACCALLAKGVHVLVEKPLASTIADCDRMISSAARGGAILAVGHQRRHLSGWQWTKKALDEGILGTIERFEIFDGSPYDAPLASGRLWRSGAENGGVLLDLGPHTLDLVLWWFGDPARIAYRDDADGGVEADAEIDLEMASGVRGRILLSRTRRLFRGIRVYGAHGMIEMNLYTGAVSAAPASLLEGQASAPPAETIVLAFRRQLEHWVQAIAGSPASLVLAEEAARTVRLIRRCYSVRQALEPPWRRPVALPASPCTERQRKPVLVTGGSGFIGGRLVEILASRGGPPVRALVRDYDRCARLARNKVDIIRVGLTGDPRQTAALVQAMEGCDTVYHAAFDPRASTGQSVAAARQLADCVCAAGVRRFVHVSSTAVYQPFPDGDLDEDAPADLCGQVYADTKLLVEREILRQVRDHGLPAVILQPSIVYGPFSRLWTDRPVEQLMSGAILLPDQEPGWCNAVHVDDVVQALLRVGEAPDQIIGRRYIINGPDLVSWPQFFGAYAAMLGCGEVRCMPVQEILAILDRRARVQSALVVAKSLLKSWGSPLREFARARLGTTGVARLRAAIDGRPGGMVLHPPDRPALALYQAKVRLKSDRAHADWGYAPVYDFATGMAATAEYVRWAWRDFT